MHRDERVTDEMIEKAQAALAHVRYGLTDTEMRAALSAALSEQTLPKPVAWYVKDYADGWIHFDNEADAIRQQEATGAMMHVAFPAYAHPPRSSLVDNSHASEAVVDLSEVLAKIKDYGEDAQPGSEYRLACDDLIELFSSLRPAEVGSATNTKGRADG